MERLQKIIANSGYCSRRKAEELIKSGKVIVNDQTVKELGFKAKYSDLIIVNGTKIAKEDKEYYVLNKPNGVVSTTKDEHNRKSVIDFVNTTARIYPIGRLDYDTTGIILLTNDGELANNLMHPSYEVLKTYLAKINGILSGEEIYKLKHNLIIDKIKVEIKKLKIKTKDKLKNTSTIEISIMEGRNHIVKRIFESLGYEVLRLKRTHYAFLDLENLKMGEYRSLTFKEVKKLYSLKK